MKTAILILSTLILVSCDTKTIQSNSEQSPIKTTESSDSKARFEAFIGKFKPIDLPYVFRETQVDHESLIDYKRLDPNSIDTIFMKSPNMDQIYCVGYLNDTTSYFALIFMFPADSYYPVLITYSKEGRTIGQESIIANGVGWDCGMGSYSMNGIISTDYSIHCSDSIFWDYFCDDEGEPIPESSESWVYLKTGKIKKNGKIEMDQEKEFKTKNNP